MYLGLPEVGSYFKNMLCMNARHRIWLKNIVLWKKWKREVDPGLICVKKIKHVMKIVMMNVYTNDGGMTECKSNDWMNVWMSG